MVSKKRVKLNLEIDIDIQTDLITNRIRIKKVEDGIIKSISKGLYQEGLSFDIKKFNFDIEKIINSTNKIQQFFILKI